MHDVWKWLATTLMGCLVGVFGTAILSMFQFNILASQIADHKAEGGHPVMETRVTAIEGDIDELKDLLREAINKMDRYHQEGQ